MTSSIVFREGRPALTRIKTKRRLPPGCAGTPHYSNNFSGATVIRYTISHDPSKTSRTSSHNGQRNSPVLPRREASSIRR